MADVIFRYINGVLRPITVGKVMVGKATGGQTAQRRQVPKQALSPDHYRTAQAFTVPNATCQVCGAKVFYYEHPNGARVLFDELGPPWPKHPCYEAGQVGKSAIGLKRPDRNKQMNVRGKHSPNWQKLGWLPLVYEKEVLLQSGKSLRVQARANHLEVRFEIPLIKLQQQGIAQSKVKDLLMLAKVEGHGVSVQLHDGLKAITFHGVLTDKETENTDKSTIKPRMLPLNQKQLQSLTKLNGPVRCKQDNDWYIELVHSFHSYTVMVKEKAFQHLIPSIKSLEAWISKPTKKGNQVVYILDRTSRQFVSAVIPMSAWHEKMQPTLARGQTHDDEPINPEQSLITAPLSDAHPVEIACVTAVDLNQKDGCGADIESSTVEEPISVEAENCVNPQSSAVVSTPNQSLTDAQMSLLIKLDGVVNCYRNKVWHVEVKQGENAFRFKFNNSAVKRLAANAASLEVWVTKVSKRARRGLYIVDAQSREYVMSSIATKELLAVTHEAEEVSNPMKTATEHSNSVNQTMARKAEKRHLSFMGHSADLSQKRDVKVIVKSRQNRKSKAGSISLDAPPYPVAKRRKEMILTVVRQGKAKRIGRKKTQAEGQPEV